MKETVFDKLGQAKLYLETHIKATQPENATSTIGLNEAIKKIDEASKLLGRLDKTLWILVICAVLMTTYAVELKIQGKITCSEACPKIYPLNYAGYEYGILGDCKCYGYTNKIGNSTLPNLTGLFNQTGKSVT